MEVRVHDVGFAPIADILNSLLSAMRKKLETIILSSSSVVYSASLWSPL